MLGVKTRVKSFIINTSLCSIGENVITKAVEDTVNRWLIDNPKLNVTQMTSSQINDSRLMVNVMYDEVE